MGRDARSRPEIGVGLELLAKSHTPDIVLNGAVKVLSEGSGEVLVVLAVLSKVVLPLKFAYDAGGLEGLGVGGETELVFNVADDLALHVLDWSSNFVVSLISHFEIRVDSFKSVVVAEVEPLVPLGQLLLADRVLLSNPKSLGLASGLGHLGELSGLSGLCGLHVDFNALVGFLVLRVVRLGLVQSYLVALVDLRTTAPSGAVGGVLVLVRGGGSFVLRDGVSDRDQVFFSIRV